MRRSLLLAAALVAAPAFAQLFGDWTEGPVPDAPPVRTQGLLPMAMEGSDLQFGVDPASISVGRDGVVRYVLVATSRSGTVNAFYTGVHCNRATFRTYARHSPSQGWRNVQGDWQPLDQGLEGRHAWRIARSGVCSARAPGGNAAQIIESLKAPPDLKPTGS